MITNTIWISKNKKGEYWTNISGTTEQVTTTDRINKLVELIKTKKSKHIDDAIKDSYIQQLIDSFNTQQTVTTIDFEGIEESIDKLINFFSEFDFTPNMRFLNTFTKLLYMSINDAKQYVSNYFELTDKQVRDVNEKMKSYEFECITNELSKVNPTKTINSRLEIHYGAQGTGKTTFAMKATNNNCIVCHSGMLPQDLMEDFKFDDGKPGFHPSQLWKAMENGFAITLDEINLLPFESLRFLQTIVDGKQEFNYKGQTITIKDGFKIYGTMNLVVNGSIFSLPEPLVDRAEKLVKYNLTAKQLMNALF